jgi:multicomponent Na+:H+ antiporter subunit G
MIEIVAAVLFLAGSFLMLITGIGMLRFPDVFCRAHAQTKAMSFGISLMLVSLWIVLGSEAQVGYKVLVALAALVITIPVSGHMIGFIGYRKNVPRYRHRAVDRHLKLKAVKRRR